MLQEMLASYGIDWSESASSPIGNGLINTTWIIKTPSGKFILQKINDAIFKKPYDIAANISMIAHYLSLQHPKYLFVAPLKTKAGDEISYLPGKGYFRLYPFIEKSFTINTIQNPQQAYEAANKFGEFTRKLSGFDISRLKITLPDFHNLSLRYRQFLNSLENGDKERVNQLENLIDFITGNKNITTAYENILQNSSFKLRVTHHDTKISNILFDKNDEGICVIDLDTVMPGYFISDVGDMFRTYLSPVNEEEKDFSKIEIRDEYFKAVWNGYMNEMKDELSVAEKDHFMYAGKFMIYMQAIRFITDYINGDVYYTTNYKDQNFVRAGNQVVLLKRLMEKEKHLLELIQ